jgi:predicted Rossmann-fold nucleotide-binding protein
MHRYGEIVEIESLAEFKRQAPNLKNVAIQGVDFSAYPFAVAPLKLHNTIFLGCRFADDQHAVDLQRKGAIIFPGFDGLPYDPYRADLYSVEELMAGYTEQDDQSLDKKIYEHFSHHRHHGVDIIESLSQRIHDHAIDNALYALLGGRDDGVVKNPVGIMGGHGTSRLDASYRQVSEIARSLTRKGYFVMSGGGPGIMEAANLGAWLADYPDDALTEALGMLSVAPTYCDPGFTPAAESVVARFPDGCDSLAIPTWFYGHEPSNVFSRHIAKYFANSLREDGLLAVATSGVIYAKGSAGTLQEVFMDLCQNHYTTFKYISPMVFLGRKYYEEETLLYPMLQKFSEGRAYQPFLGIFDDVDDVVAFIETHPPVLGSA